MRTESENINELYIMAKKEFKNEDAQLENVNEALNTTSLWIEQNSKVISIVIAAIAALVLGVIAINNYVIKPTGQAASDENAKAVAYFMQGDYDRALLGDDADCMGFEAIADKYSLYQQGELAALYAGICHYQKGEYEEAAKYIKKFSAGDKAIDPAAKVLLGDAYVQMDDLNKAASAFISASKSDNEIIAPVALKKAGLVYLEMGDKKAAHKAFTTIKKKYPAATEAQDIDKYIALAQ